MLSTKYRIAGLHALKSLTSSIEHCCFFEILTRVALIADPTWVRVLPDKYGPGHKLALHSV
jgi:hypothetical protein